MSQAKQLFEMWKEKREAQAPISRKAKEELKQVLPYVRELEERITALGWEVENVTELYHMEIAGEDW